MNRHLLQMSFGMELSDVVSLDVDKARPLSWRVQWLASQIRSQRLVACPAEAVWGLSCDPLSATAVADLLALKRRPMHKGLIVVAATASMFEPLLATLPSTVQRELALSWPGSNTWLVPNRGFFPPWITGDSDEVAIRVTAAPQLRALSTAVGGPLVSTSANPAGQEPARTSLQVVRYFGPGLPRAADSGATRGRPSIIRRAGSSDVIRA